MSGNIPSVGTCYKAAQHRYCFQMMLAFWLHRTLSSTACDRVGMRSRTSKPLIGVFLECIQLDNIPTTSFCTYFHTVFSNRLPQYV